MNFRPKYTSFHVTFILNLSIILSSSRIYLAIVLCSSQFHATFNPTIMLCPSQLSPIIVLRISPLSCYIHLNYRATIIPIIVLCSSLTIVLCSFRICLNIMLGSFHYCTMFIPLLYYIRPNYYATFNPTIAMFQLLYYVRPTYNIRFVQNITLCISNYRIMLCLSNYHATFIPNLPITLCSSQLLYYVIFINMFQLLY